MCVGVRGVVGRQWTKNHNPIFWNSWTDNRKVLLLHDVNVERTMWWMKNNETICGYIGSL